MPSHTFMEPDSYLIRTYGCQMNVHDSEHIAGVLEESGYSPASKAENAEIIVFNTCCVRKGAEDKVWGNLGALQSADESPLVVVCGCMAERHGHEIIERFPVVDIVFGLDALERLPELIRRSGSGPVCDLGDKNEAEPDGLPSVRGRRSSAWVPVSHGCDNHCSYCVVPGVRGGERSRSPYEIMAEAESLVGDGVVEITLLGQNINSYGRDLYPSSSFAELLRSVSSVPGIRRVKYETSHPKDLTDDILAVMAERPEVCEHLHLPVQSGSDRILRAMNRGHDRRFYVERVRKAREIVKDLVVSTDIIVGFPGESDADFIDTLDLVEIVGFDSAFIFIYSERDGTPASRMTDEVPSEVKSDRFMKLSRLQDKKTLQSLSRLLGRSVEVMVEGPARKGDYVVGRTRGSQVVLLPATEAAVDSLVTARVSGVGKHAARGNVTGVLYTYCSFRNDEG
jgi:tRNA-2-methylthio-N6-dimethylallyladenosine synthase